MLAVTAVALACAAPLWPEHHLGGATSVATWAYGFDVPEGAMGEAVVGSLGEVYVPIGNAIHKIDRNIGSWNTTTSAPCTSLVLTHRAHGLYALCGASVMSFDAASGDAVAAEPVVGVAADAVFLPLVYDPVGAQLIVATTRGAVFAFAAVGLFLIWQYEATAPLATAPLATGEYVILGDTAQTLTFLSPTLGTVRATMSTSVVLDGTAEP